jgi:hypothetical protein
VRRELAADSVLRFGNLGSSSRIVVADALSTMFRRFALSQGRT